MQISKKIKQTFLSALFGLSAIITQAQNGTVSGTVNRFSSFCLMTLSFLEKSELMALENKSKRPSSFLVSTNPDKNTVSTVQYSNPTAWCKIMAAKQNPSSSFYCEFSRLRIMKT